MDKIDENPDLYVYMIVLMGVGGGVITVTT